MGDLRAATANDLDRWMADSLSAGVSAECFEELAQEVCQRLYRTFSESIVLARCYVTVPFTALPERNAIWVRGLAEAKGVLPELREGTPVISLVGSAGRLASWNSRFESQGHVGIPMVSASFIDAIPMMSRLMASLGGSLSWIDSRDISHVVSRLGSVSGLFYVAEAATDVDSRGRKIIPAADFVEEYGVKTVFGAGGAFQTGQIFVLLAFCRESIPLAIASQFQRPLLEFKTNAAPYLRKVFVDGPSIDVSMGRRSAAPRAERISFSQLPVDPLARAEQLMGLLSEREREIDELNRLYLRLEAQLEDRTRSLRTILNATSDGLLVVDPDGSIYGETTAAVERWFGTRQPRAKVWSYLLEPESPVRDGFELGFSQLVDEVLPFDVAASQMPQRFERAGRVYSLRYEPVRKKERLERVLVVLRDVTAEVEATRAERRARELQTVMGNLLRDRRGFVRFVEETQSLFERLGAPPDRATERRDLHTIKGNAAVFGFETFAEIAHRIESKLMEADRSLSGLEREELGLAWKRELTALAEMAEIELGPAVEIPISELDDFVRRLRDLAQSGPLIDLARRWRYEPVKITLGCLASQAMRIGERLGKDVRVRIEDHGVRLPLERTQPIWSALVHVVRNAVDHGIEDAERRRELGKNATGTITLSCRVSHDAWIVAVSDDGAGIDWTAVRRAAESAGIDCGNQSELTEALFRDGFTTRAQASEISGRGVGLSALRAACRSLGANVEVSSAAGHGTVVSIALPLALLEAS